MALVASIAMVSCVDLPPQQIQAAEVKAAAQVKNAELAAKRALEENVLKAEAEGERIRLATLEYETAMRMGDPALAEEVYAHVMAGGSPVLFAGYGYPTSGRKLLSEENMNQEHVEEDASNRKLLQPGVYHGPVVNHIRRDVARRQVRLGVRQGRPIAGIASAAGVMHGGWPRLHAHPFLG